MRGYLAFLVSHTLLLSGLCAASTNTEVAPPDSAIPSLSSSLSTTPPSASNLTSDEDTESPLSDITKIYTRRLSIIAAAVTDASYIQKWLSTLGSDGKWPDSEVDYTSGCPARRANWPAQTHWQRLKTMSAAWHGGVSGAEQYVKNGDLRNAISDAMDFWFANDFTTPACLDSGGQPSCPCGTPGFWNTNWFSNIILIPDLVGQSCVLLNGTLSDAHLRGCMRITSRSYATFDGPINGAGILTGANALDVASIGIDSALLTVNASLISDAYGKVHEELVIQDKVKADGIRLDGSFGQHAGILYNGNYGTDYANDVLDLEIESSGTEFAASDKSKQAFATLIDGDQWMIYRNVITGVLHWDFSVLGRFISFPVADLQATGSIKVNLTEMKQLGSEWQSKTLIDVSDSLSKETKDANTGNLKGNRMFYANDYMVHRGLGYVTTLKMYSSRTKNTECTNTQNPLGFHLADGVVHNYIQGDEYEDIAAAWDWNLIPGTTVDYGATELTCDNTQFTGIEAFVGGASDGVVGVAAMRYTNPSTESLRWQKAWFFLDDDVQYVMIADIASANESAPVLSILDQRRHVGGVFVDGIQTEPSGTTTYPGAKSIWHGNVGYTFPKPNDAFQLSLKTGSQTGDWSKIGTSSQPPVTVDLLAAWINHNNVSVAVEYAVFPGIAFDNFASKIQNPRIQSLQNDGHISAIYDQTYHTAMIVYWDANGGSISFTPSPRDAQITITSSTKATVIYRLDTGTITASDPSQTLKTVTVTLTLGNGRKPSRWGNGRSKTLKFTLRSGGLAGNSVSQTLQN